MSKKSPTLAELEEAECDARENLTRTLSDPEDVLMEELPTAEELSPGFEAEEINYVAANLAQFAHNLLADANDWGEAFKALINARAKAKKAA